MRSGLGLKVKYAPLVGLALILLVYFSLTTLTSWCAPLGVGPDEVAHFMLARFLEQKGYLPLTPEERQAAGYKSDQPPLNAMLVATTFFWDDINSPPFVKLTHDMPRRHLVTGPDTIAEWRVINSEDPLAGEVLFWRVGRFMSTLFSTVTLIITYILALLIFEDMPHKALWALATVTSLAFIPTFVFVSSVLSYENLLGLWMSLYLLVAVYIIKRNCETIWLYVVAGLLVGLAIATKFSALPAPLSLIGLVLLISRRADWSKWKQLARLALTMLGMLVGVGWWFAWVMIKLNQVNELGWVFGLIQPIIVSDGSDITSVEVAYFLSGGKIGSLVGTPDRLNLFEWAERVFRTFWRLQWQGQETIFLVLALITVFVLLGLVKVWFQKRTAPLWLVWLSAHILLFFILPFIRLIFTHQTITGQGQHVLFPATGAFAVLITWGLGAWFPVRWQWVGGMLLGGGLLVWSVYQASQIYQPPLPVRTISPNLPPSAKITEIDFDSMTLVGYELRGLKDNATCCDAAHPALGINLYWQARELIPADYLTEISLVDSAGEAKTGWIGHPVNGRYPTRAWEPGDFVRDEIWLPVARLSPGEYKLTFRLLGHQVYQNEPFSLGQIELVETAELDDPVANGHQPTLDLWQQGQIVKDFPSFESRSTIQITTDENVDLSLVGPDQVVRAPVDVIGQTHIFVVGLTWPRGDYYLQVESVDQPTWESPLLLFIWGEGRKTEAPPSQVTVNANFANQLMLLGYNLPQRKLAPGDLLPIILNFQALHIMPADFIMFTRLLDEMGEVWGGYDRRPREAYSTLLWAENEVVEDGFTIQVDPAAPDGVYYLDVGFYLLVGDTAVSLPLVLDGQMSDVTSVPIGPIEIKRVP